jgi:hypothetical protein
MDWKSIVKTVAPLIGTALGGPMGGVASRAIAGALLGDEGAAQSEIEAAVLSANPDALIKLREADNAFAVQMKALDVDLERIHQADRGNARDREIQTGDQTPQILGAVIVCGFFFTLYFIATQPMPAQAIQPINILLGALTAMLIQVGNYFYGSSRGSAKKNDTIARLNR